MSSYWLDGKAPGKTDKSSIAYEASLYALPIKKPIKRQTIT